MTNADAARLQEIDRSCHYHPFTDHSRMHQRGTHIVSSGRGCFVTDESGKELLDGLAGLWCVNVGYGRKEIIEAIRGQLEELSFYPSFFQSTTPSAIELAQRLDRLSPKSVSHSFFCCSGSEANETAIKIIWSYNQIKGRPHKRKILSRQYAYHGVGLGSSSITGLAPCHLRFGLPLSGFLHAPTPYGWAAGRSDLETFADECLQKTKEMIHEEGPETIAAMFAEPVQGAGGVIVPPVSYYLKLRDLCREHDILFVADEVITGFGRLGDWFASNLWGVEPDMLILAKGVTSGYIPLGATLFSSEIADVLDQGGLFSHGFTYSGHPVACSAALANIDLLEKEKLPERVHKLIGPYFRKKLAEVAEHPAVGEVRSAGLVAGLELLPPDGRKALKPELALGDRAAALCREEGLIVRSIRNMIALSPPLIITEGEVDQLQASMLRALDRLWS